ncbi:MAG: transposase [Saprospiraceae bacterium]|nr:transposase [Saprospiraceae bacterium]MBX2891163.1 transposase [Saprospiraceae bacterium]MBX2891262.1 transposase [Saprospiraceae bacterium]
MKKANHYSDQFKKRVVNEVLSGEESLEYYRRKYRIGGSMTISRWIDKFATEELVPMSTKRKDSEEVAELKAELALLRRELADERLRREAYQLMVKIAEEEFDIPIEKKFGVKQPKK